MSIPAYEPARYSTSQTKISRLIFPYHLEKSKVYNEIYVCNVLYIPEFKMKEMKTLFIGASKDRGRPLPLSGF